VMKEAIERDRFAHWGRGLTVALALALPLLDSLDSVPIPGSKAIPIVTLLMLLISLLAVGSVIRSGTDLKRWWIAPLLLMGVVLLGGSGAIHRSGQPLWDIARVWSLILLSTAVAIHYAGQKLERTGVLTAVLFGGLIAAIFGILEFLGWPVTHELAKNGVHPDSRWSILLRTDGPFNSAEEYAWFLAVMLPVMTLTVYTLQGRKRDLAALGFAVLWAGIIASLSMTVALVSLLAVLIIVFSKVGFKNPYPGLPFTLSVITLLMALSPVVRARWQSTEPPVQVIVEEMESLKSVDEPDSLSVILTNGGRVAWSSHWQAGLQVFGIQEYARDDDLFRWRGWMGHELGKRVRPGESITLHFPAPAEGRGVFAVDLLGPSGFLSTTEGLSYVITWQGDREDWGMEQADEFGVVKDLATLRMVEGLLYENLGGSDKHGRFETWRDALSLHRAKPLFGLGAGSMQEMLGFDARNIHLQLLVNYGIVGTVLVYGLLVLLAVRLAARGTREANLYLLLLFTLLLLGTFEYVLDQLPASVLTSILLGIAWASAFSQQPEEES